MECSLFPDPQKLAWRQRQIQSLQAKYPDIFTPNDTAKCYEAGEKNTEDNGDINVTFPVKLHKTARPGALNSKRKALSAEPNTDVGDCLGIVAMPLRKKKKELDPKSPSKKGSLPLQMMPNASIPAAHKRDDKTFLNGLQCLRGENNPIDVPPLQINMSSCFTSTCYCNIVGGAPTNTSLPLPTIFMENEPSSHSALHSETNKGFDYIRNTGSTGPNKLTPEPMPEITDEAKKSFGGMFYAIHTSNMENDPAAFTFDSLMDIVDEQYGGEFVFPDTADPGLLTLEPLMEIAEDDYEEPCEDLTVAI